MQFGVHLGAAHFFLLLARVLPAASQNRFPRPCRPLSRSRTHTKSYCPTARILATIFSHSHFGIQATLAVFAAGAAHRTQLTTRGTGAADSCDKTQPRVTRDIF